MAAHVRSILRLASLEVVVLHTTTSETLAALKTAARLADGLAARIRLLVIQVVPYPLPLNRPPAALPFTQRRFQTLAEGASIETHVDIHLVRDRDLALQSLLEPHSTIVTGGKRLKKLERAGHEVIYPDR
jgi:hypothetical protein